MLKKFLVGVLLIVCIAPVAAQDETLSQWASWAAASSEYGETDYGAMQATGEPDTESCADSTTAWASKIKNGEERLTLYFDEAVYPTQVNVYQNYNPGSITAIKLIPDDGGAYIPLDESADEAPEDCPWTFSIDIEDVDVAVIGVEIELDQSEIENWDEIDAVELVGYSVYEEGEEEDYTSPEEEAETTEETTETTSEQSNTTNSNVPFGRSVVCDEGGRFDNGLEFTIAVRTGSTYTITAVGLNDFDPILWVARDNGTGPCSDDSFEATSYGAYLPTTGEVYTSERSAQVVYYSNGDGSGFENVTFVVGGHENQGGQVLLFVEGLTLTYEDGSGDPIWAYISPSMVSSGMPLTAYLIAITDYFDPWVGLVNNQLEVYRDSNNTPYSCDNSGYTCWGVSYNLDGYYVSHSQGRLLYSDWRDAMLTIPLQMQNAGYSWGFLLSTVQGTSGDYVAVFHVGVGEP